MEVKTNFLLHWKNTKGEANISSEGFIYQGNTAYLSKSCMGHWSENTSLWIWFLTLKKCLCLNSAKITMLYEYTDEPPPFNCIASGTFIGHNHVHIFETGRNLNWNNHRTESRGKNWEIFQSVPIFILLYLFSKIPGKNWSFCLNIWSDKRICTANIFNVYVIAC